MQNRRVVLSCLSAVLIAGMLAGVCSACSVLSHEAIVDAAWLTKIEPLLRANYPEANAEQLKTAHGYAYGGAIIQDLGYYPHGSKRFSDMTHYVRTGDFVAALLAEAHDVNELAFALGALSHYFSDSEVHRLATNPGEAMLYPQLEHRFGPVVTYEQDPAAHLKTEFGFDVLEVAKGNFAPEAYHNFIGFAVAMPLLDRAFRKTYGMELSELFPNTDLTIGSYRRAVSRTIPAATRIAWANRGRDIKGTQPGMTRSKFVYFMTRSSYEREWGRQYDRPTLRDRVAGQILRIIPPIGPLRALRFKMPTPPVEKLFMQAFDKAMTEYEAQMGKAPLGSQRMVNTNYDLGVVGKPGVYALQDEAYAFWLHELAKSHFETATPDMREEFVTYFQGAPIGCCSKKHALTADQLAADLVELKRVSTEESMRMKAVLPGDVATGK